MLTKRIMTTILMSSIATKIFPDVILICLLSYLIYNSKRGNLTMKYIEDFIINKFVNKKCSKCQSTSVIDGLCKKHYKEDSDILLIN